MCGRYNILPNAYAFLDGFDIAVNQIGQLSARYNIAPSQMIPIVREAAQGRELVMCKWGLIPHWAKEEKSKYHMINAKAETITTKPAFRDAFKTRRCLIPASGFYEWRKEDKQPFNVTVKQRPLFAMAGLWEHWEGEDGKVVESCTIITTDANNLLQPIHDRMPAIIPIDQYANWLNPINNDKAVLMRLLKPFPANQLHIHAVSKAVNSVNNDSEELVLPLEKEINI